MDRARVFRDAVLGLTITFAFVLPPDALHALPGRGEGDEIIYRSGDLRIVRTYNRDGSVRVTLTNLDEDGNRLGAETEEALCPPQTVTSEAQETPEPGVPAPRPIDLRVHVNSSPSTPPDQGEDGGDGSYDGTGSETIVININTGGAGTELPPYPVTSLPWIPVVGLPGAFRYPDHLPFLGYGTGASSPSLFAGAGHSGATHFSFGTGGFRREGHRSRPGLHAGNH